MGIFDRFKKREPKTLLDAVQDLASKAIPNCYRRLAADNGTAPTSKTSDQKIIEIYQQVGSAFQEASALRNEILPAGNMNYIVYKFLNLYETTNEEFFYEHLKYEVNKYIQEGLRDDYKKDLRLF